MGHRQKKDPLSCVQNGIFLLPLKKGSSNTCTVLIMPEGQEFRGISQGHSYSQVKGVKKKKEKLKHTNCRRCNIYQVNRIAEPKGRQPRVHPSSPASPRPAWGQERAGRRQPAPSCSLPCRRRESCAWSEREARGKRSRSPPRAGWQVGLGGARCRARREALRGSSKPARSVLDRL